MPYVLDRPLTFTVTWDSIVSNMTSMHCIIHSLPKSRRRRVHVPITAKYNHCTCCNRISKSTFECALVSVLCNYCSCGSA